MQFARDRGHHPGARSRRTPSACAIDEALRCKRDGKRQTILFNLSRPRPLRPRRLRRLPGRQARGLRVPGREGRGSARAGAEGQGVGGAAGTRPPYRVSAHAVRVLRLGAGLVLLTYLTTHYLNHALGIVSLASMEAGRVWFLWLWRQPLVSSALYTALVVHVFLGFWALYRRRTLRMPAWEATQLVLGLTIPPILVAHVVGNRLAHELYGINDSYARVLLVYWVNNPWRGQLQTALLLIAWIHGCMGVHFWLRFRPAYAHAAVWLVGVAVTIPVLALAGFVQGGLEVIELSRTPAWIAAVTAGNTPATRAHLTAVAEGITATYGALLALTLAMRGARVLYLRRWYSVRIAYPGGRVVTVPIGFSVLEASRHAGLPHASVCGGRGRCSTCRVRIVRGLDTLPGGERGRATRAAPHRRAAGRPAGVPAPPRTRDGRRPAPGGPRRPRGPPRRRAPGRRAGGRRALRRSARLHANGRAPAALRRRLPPQPLLPGGGLGDRARRRHRQPVHRRRHDGALRRGARAGDRLPRGPHRGGRA